MPEPAPQSAMGRNAAFFLGLAVWVLFLTALWVGATYYLFYEDQGRGFGLLTLALVLQLGVGWKLQWRQKRAAMKAEMPTRDA